MGRDGGSGDYGRLSARGMQDEKGNDLIGGGGGS